MKRLILISVGTFFLLAAVSSNSHAQTTVTGHITAEVIDALAAAESLPMKLSALSADKIFNAASFSVSDASDATFSVTLPEGPTTLTHASGNNTLVVTDWTATSEQNNDGYVLAGGIRKVFVGATLKAGNSNTSTKGTYTGSYQVTFSYN